MQNKTSPKTRYPTTFDLVVISRWDFCHLFSFFITFLFDVLYYRSLPFCAHLHLLVLQIDENNLYLELYRLNNIIVQSLNTWTDF